MVSLAEPLVTHRLPVRLLSALSVVSLLGAALGAAAAPASDPRVTRIERALPGFATERSERFVLVAEGDPSERAALFAVMEATADAVERFADRYGLPRRERGAPMVAVGFRDRSAFERFAAAEDGVDARALGGYWLPGAERTVFRAGPPVGSDPERRGVLASLASADLATVAHETAHQVLHRLGIQRRSPGQPLWIREGLAIAFECVAVEGPDANPFARRALRDRRLRDAAREGQLVPLQRLVTATALPAPGRGDARRFYEQSASLTAFLARERPEAFAAYLRALANGAGRLRARDALAIFERSFGPAVAVEEAWRKSLSTG